MVLQKHAKNPVELWGLNIQIDQIIVIYSQHNGVLQCIHIKFGFRFLVKARNIKYPMILGSELKNVNNPIIANFVQAKATTNNEIQMLTNITVLENKLFF